jgi:predicted DNA binding protein
MSLPYRSDIIPHHRRGCEVLLESVDFEIDQLTPEQLAAIRKAYYLDDPRSIRELVESGDLQP